MVEIGIRVLTTQEEKEILEGKVNLNSIFVSHAQYRTNPILLEFYNPSISPHSVEKELDTIRSWLKYQKAYSMIEIDKNTNKTTILEKKNDDYENIFESLKIKLGIKF